MPELTQAERNQLVSQISSMQEQVFGPAARKIPPLERRKLRQQRDGLLEQYNSNLPQVPIARCPFTQQVVTKAMDVFGMDGPWWDVNADDWPPVGSTLVVCYQGALHYNGTQPQGVATSKLEEVRTGPETPFVIPRLLQMVNVCCVVSSLQMFVEPLTAYFITYFANPRIKAELSHPNWLRSEFAYVTPDGRSLLGSCDDEYDFDLGRWLAQPDKVYWIDPGDTEMQLKTGPGCPYLNLAGRQAVLSIREGVLEELPLPAGDSFDPSDLFD